MRGSDLATIRASRCGVLAKPTVIMVVAMSKSVFISHASADSAKAAVVSQLLMQAEIVVRFDRQELLLGDSFLTFMERALASADYCLLLWSQSAAGTPWVQMEWEAALSRSVREKRSFLLVGRLEEVPPPVLLAPRLRVDLFPELQPGIGRILETWRADRSAENETQRPVAGVAVPNHPEPGSATIYVTSEYFGITVPLDADLDTPAGVYLDRILNDFKLPRTLDYEGRGGVRYGYRLMNTNRPLDRSIPLAGQDVKNKSILWLETTITPYAQSVPLQGTLRPTVFRGRRSPEEDSRATLEALGALGRKQYMATITRNGLGAVEG